MNVSISDKAAELDKLLEETTEFTNYKEMAQRIEAILPDMNETEIIAMYRQAVTRRAFRILRERADSAQKEHIQRISADTVFSVVNAILENKEAFAPALDWIADEISSRLKARPI